MIARFIRAEEFDPNRARDQPCMDPIRVHEGTGREREAQAFRREVCRNTA
jgi:hypothetical protein